MFTLLLRLNPRHCDMISATRGFERRSAPLQTCSISHPEFRSFVDFCTLTTSLRPCRRFRPSSTSATRWPTSSPCQTSNPSHYSESPGTSPPHTQTNVSLTIIRENTLIHKKIQKDNLLVLYLCRHWMGTLSPTPPFGSARMLRHVEVCLRACMFTARGFMQPSL